MNDFDYDSLQRKRLARNARYKKGGSKSHKCTLPQDTMSAAELKRRNGEVKTYNLSAPMSWKEFKALPDDLKREYILGLREKFNVNASKLAQMLGVSDVYLRGIIRSLGLAETTHRNMSKEQLSAWTEFCNPCVTLDPLEDIKPCEPEEERETEIAPPVKISGCAINSGLLTFTGKAPDITIALMKFLGDKDYRITVEFEEM